MCELVDELKKLKKSSDESIDNEKSFSVFKQYMHVERQVQKDLEKIVAQSKHQKKALILVCGNVGDGKSHIISYLKNAKHILDGFVIHNDATESYSRHQTEKEALAKVISAFSDDNIDSDFNSKVIVAINLGVLSNFIYSDEGEKFSQLREYVEENKILVDGNCEPTENTQGVFSHVNFGDYHLYRLNNETVDSPYINEILKRIFNNLDDNPFYKSYKDCSYCPHATNCPVKINYETLQNHNVKNGVISILIEAIIKDKLIVSTRELLNFIYDIVVHPDFNPDVYKGDFYWDYLMPNLLYGHSDMSELLSHISKYDLINTRRENLDEIITEFINSNNPLKLLAKYISENACCDAIQNNCKQISKKENKSRILILFLHLLKIAPISKEIQTTNDEYYEFVHYLYSSNKGVVNQIRKLSRMVEECVYKATASNDKEKIVLKKYGDKYSVSTKLSINIGKNLLSSETENLVFDKFSEKIKLSFYVNFEGQRNDEEIYIDYELYDMLIKIHNGYRVSAKEKSYYATFFSFVEKMIMHSNYKSELYINVFENGNSMSYKLLNDEDYGYEFGENR